MNKGVEYTGIPTLKELQASPGVPREERMVKGPVLCIECVQEIPCNPCETACPFGAITVGKPITNLPILDEEKCTGCSICVACCPGLAIFKIEKNYTDKTSLVEFPYEYLPIPIKGSIVPCVNRAGEYVADGKVRSVENRSKNDNTALIAVEIPKEYYMEIRSIQRKEDNQYEPNR